MGRVERLGAAGLAATAAVLALVAVAAVRMGARDAAAPAPDPVELVIVCDSPSAEPLRAVPQADGPFYDMPLDVEQSVVCDRSNREYVLLSTPEGGVAITPLLDEAGEQAVMPRP